MTGYIAMRLRSRSAGGDTKMLFTELPDARERWPIQDENGRHYLAELAVTWVDTEYWSRTASSAEQRKNEAESRVSRLTPEPA